MIFIYNLISRHAIYANRLYLSLFKKCHPEYLATTTANGPKIIGAVRIHPSAQIDSTAVVCIYTCIIIYNYVDVCPQNVCMFMSAGITFKHFPVTNSIVEQNPHTCNHASYVPTFSLGYVLQKNNYSYMYLCIHGHIFIC